MATYYWVGGTGNWNGTNTANWSTSSGGAGGAGPPTLADDVVFDVNSDVASAAFAVSGSATAVCNNFTASGLGATMTLSNQVSVYGNWTNPSTNFVRNVSVTFKATATGKTIATNGVTTTQTTTFDGVGGGWTLTTALTGSSTSAIQFYAGALNTNGFAVTTGSIRLFNGSTSTQAIRSLTLGASTFTVAEGWSPSTLYSNIDNTSFDASVTDNLTINAGTSTIVFSDGTGALKCGRGYTAGFTFYNVSFTSALAGSKHIFGNNNFNTLTFTRRTTGGTSLVNIGGNQTITAATNGFTIGAATSANFRYAFKSWLPDRAVTMTMASRGTMADIDFQNVTIAGAAGTLTGTRIGNAGGNTNITFTAARTVYWSLAAGGTWETSTCWATTSGGAPALNNFPLPQDTIVINNTNLNSGSTITIGSSVFIPTISASGRTNSMILASSSQSFFVGDITFGSGLTSVTNFGPLTASKIGGTQTITAPAIDFPCGLIVDGTSTVFTSGPTGFGTLGISCGTLDLNGSDFTVSGSIEQYPNQDVNDYGFAIYNKTMNTSVFCSKSIIFGTNKINLTPISTASNQIACFVDYTGFSCTGTPLISCTTASGSVILSGGLGYFTGGTQANYGLSTSAPSSESFALNVTVSSPSSHTGRLNSNGSTPFFANTIDLSNYKATLDGNQSVIFYLYGSIIFGTGMSTVQTSISVTTLSASATQTITNNGRTISTLNCSNTGTGNTLFGSAFISASSLTITSGTLSMNGFSGTVFRLSISGTATKQMNMGSQTLICTTTTAGQSAVSTSSGSNFSFADVTSGTIQTRGSTIFDGEGLSWPTWDYFNTTIDNPVVNVTGSNTFYNITNASSTRATTVTYTFAAGTTNTFTNWNVVGSSAEPILIRSSVPGSQATLSKASGTVVADYYNIQDSNAIGGAYWNATDPTNTDSGNNTGWIFVMSTNSNFFMFM